MKKKLAQMSSNPLRSSAESSSNAGITDSNDREQVEESETFVADVRTLSALVAVPNTRSDFSNLTAWSQATAMFVRYFKYIFGADGTDIAADNFDKSGSGELVVCCVPCFAVAQRTGGCAALPPAPTFLVIIWTLMPACLRAWPLLIVLHGREAHMPTSTSVSSATAASQTFPKSPISAQSISHKS
jgi:hypothetical protein